MLRSSSSADCFHILDTSGGVGVGNASPPSPPLPSHLSAQIFLCLTLPPLSHTYGVRRRASIVYRAVDKLAILFRTGVTHPSSSTYIHYSSLFPPHTVPEYFSFALCLLVYLSDISPGGRRRALSNFAKGDFLHTFPG